jgi:hypothetical protein
MRITPEQLLAGHIQYAERERRDAIYKTATFLVKNFWGKPAEVAEGLGVLLLVWNSAHYRYGSFDFDELERSIADNQELLKEYRNRTILSYVPKDDSRIRSLFQGFLESLKICEKASKGKRSPVAVAKALHLLAPNFFPLWDEVIAREFGCHYADNASGNYLDFLRIIKDTAERLDKEEEVQSLVRTTGRTLIKLIDEYNYVTYTLPELKRKAEANLKKKAGR